MNNLLITSAKVVFPNHPFYDQEVDVLVENGKITRIASRIDPDDRFDRFDAKGQYLAPGFFDLNVNFGEPGLETKEDLISGCAARSEEHTSELQSRENL